MFGKIKNLITNTVRMAKALSDGQFDKFKEDQSGESAVTKLIMLFVLAIMAGALLPTGIDALASGKNSSGTWSAAETATYAVIGIILIIAVVMLVVRLATE